MSAGTPREQSPIVWVHLCAPCAGYIALTMPDYQGALSGGCQGCGCEVRELHRFAATIDSASGCNCRTDHRQVAGNLVSKEGSDGTEIITPRIAASVLFHYRAGGLEAGSFTMALIALIGRADPFNRAALGRSFPAHVEAVQLIEGTPDGVAQLTRIAEGDDEH